MKRLIGLLVFLLFAGNILAQKISQSNVPAVILNSFQVKFPNTDDVDWRLEKGNYRVNFEVNDKDHEVRLDDRGKIVKHVQDLFVSEIPDAVLQTIRKKVSFFDVEDADKITEDGKTIFEINFETDDKDHDFWITEKGKLLKYRKELKKSEVPDLIWSHIKATSGNLDIENTEYTEENGRGVYWIDGDINDKEHDYYFTEKGKLISRMQELRKNEIPAGILSAIKTKYSGYEIRNALLKEDNSSTSYDIQLRKSRENITLTFNQKGELIGPK
ncbi:MAG: PepSY-like domain-containing protein, partial [Bacteroidales bacterium]|nr:PepSY-like domain-containing protein [Bacteroidales bacterium]